MANIQHILGLMSGTSLDGIDMAILATDGAAHITAGSSDFAAYDDKTRQHLRAVLDKVAMLATADLQHRKAWPDWLQAAEAQVTQAHCAAVQNFLSDKTNGEVTLIGFHGQTICHRPQEGFTLQIGDGAALAQAVGVPVIGQFRLADMAAGGQGAPLAPLFHAALIGEGLIGEGQNPIAVVNLGGIANVTWLHKDKIIAFDTGPANALLDDWVAHHSDAPYDKDGALAARGQVDEAALATLLAHDYFTAPPPKSLDRLAFNMAALQGLSPADGAATLSAFTVQALALGLAQCPAAPQRIILCGGGRHNQHIVTILTAQFSAQFGGEVALCEALGWQGDNLEAQAFAWLAARAQQGLPLSVPTTTGVKTPISGGQLYMP